MKELIVHAAATPPSMDIGAREIRRWHTDPKPQGNGWSDIGYHYVIRRDGTLELGRDLDGDGDVLDEQGAHVLGHNENTVGVCLAGGINEAGEDDCNFTAAQYACLESLYGYLKKRFPDMGISGHREYDDSKGCPCFDVKAWASTVVTEA